MVGCLCVNVKYGCICVVELCCYMVGMLLVKIKV